MFVHAAFVVVSGKMRLISRLCVMATVCDFYKNTRSAYSCSSSIRVCALRWVGCGRQDSVNCKMIIKLIDVGLPVTYDRC